MSTDGNEVVVEVKMDKAKYKRGQRVVATVIVSDVVAQGAIAEVNGKRVTIRSSRCNPIVSQRAATEAQKHFAEVSVRVVQ